MIRLLRSEFLELNINRMCQILAVSRAMVYRKKLKLREDNLLLIIEEIVTMFSGYGYRRVLRELKKRTLSVSEYRVRKTLRENGLLARRPRTLGITRSCWRDKRSANLIKHTKVTACNQAFVGDTTLIRTPFGSVYLATLLDLFSRKVVAFKLSRRNDLNLTLSCLNHAIETRRPNLSWIHHSDQGSTYLASAYTKRVRDAGGRLSHSKAGCPQENAVAESFFRTLKLEEVDRNRYECYAELEASLEYYIEQIYNEKRMHSSLGYLSPDEFEARSTGGSA